MNRTNNSQLSQAIDRDRIRPRVIDRGIARLLTFITCIISLQFSWAGAAKEFRKSISATIILSRAKLMLIKMMSILMLLLMGCSLAYGNNNQQLMPKVKWYEYHIPNLNTFVFYLPYLHSRNEVDRGSMDHILDTYDGRVSSTFVYKGIKIYNEIHVRFEGYDKEGQYTTSFVCNIMKDVARVNHFVVLDNKCNNLNYFVGEHKTKNSVVFVTTFVNKGKIVTYIGVEVRTYGSPIAPEVQLRDYFKTYFRKNIEPIIKNWTKNNR